MDYHHESGSHLKHDFRALYQRPWALIILKSKIHLCMFAYWCMLSDNRGSLYSSLLFYKLVIYLMKCEKYYIKKSWLINSSNWKLEFWTLAKGRILYSNPGIQTSLWSKMLELEETWHLMAMQNERGNQQISSKNLFPSHL